jgi:hypothetical protein
MKTYWQSIISIAVVALLAAGACWAQILPTAHYAGKWEIQPNGDVKVTRTFTLPMQMYRSWKDADIHMLEAREFDNARSNIEVVDKSAQWDDLNRTLSLRMTILGLCQNKGGGHWEAKIMPNLEFSNLDDNRKIAYFHFSAAGNSGRVEGQDEVILPSTSGAPQWNAADKVITFTLPPAGVTSAGSSAGVWLLAFLACLAAGAGLWVASFLITPASRSKAQVHGPGEDQRQDLAA